MRKFVFIIILGIILLGATGCEKIGEKTVTCVSEKVGKSPEIVYYEIYKIKNNEIVSLEKYNIRTFDKEYLKLVKIDEIIKVYESDKDTKVEKLGKNQIKVIDTNPTNVFKNSKANDMATLIVNSMEKSDFSLYRYTCTIE